MIISCPECTARFLVEAAALGATGRMVRCGKCAHTWPESPPETNSESIETAADDVSSPDPEAEPETDSAGDVGSDPQADSDFESESGQELDTARRSADRTARRGGVPALRRKRKNIVARLAWVLLILLFIGFAGGGVFLQNQVVEEWPASQRIYALLGLTREPLGAGLNLINVKFSQQGARGKRLRVEGEVENISDHVLVVPGLRATLFGKDKKDLQHVLFKAPLPRLLPGENVKFMTIIKNPAKGAVRIEIDFHEASAK